MTKSNTSNTIKASTLSANSAKYQRESSILQRVAKIHSYLFSGLWAGCKVRQGEELPISHNSVSGRVQYMFIPKNKVAYLPTEECGLVGDAYSFPIRQVTRIGWKVKFLDKNTHLSVRSLWPRPDGLAQETQRRACAVRNSGDGGAERRLEGRLCAP